MIYNLSGTDSVYNTATRCQAKSRLFNQSGVWVGEYLPCGQLLTHIEMLPDSATPPSGHLLNILFSPCSCCCQQTGSSSMKLMLHNYQATERRQSKVGILYLLSTYIGFIYIYIWNCALISPQFPFVCNALYFILVALFMLECRKSNWWAYFCFAPPFCSAHFCY